MRLHRTTNIYLFLIICLLGFGFVAQQGVMAERDEATAVTGSYPSWQTPVAITNASQAPDGARLPVVATAPNGNVTVGFLMQMSADESDTDLYYRTTSNNGTNWTPGLNNPPSPIHQSPGVRSTELDLAYSGNNTAHAVWREGDYKIYHAAQSAWNSNSFFDLTASNGAGVTVSGPRIVTSGNNRVNVVWAEAEGATYRLQFRRSLNNGSDGFPVTSTIPLVNPLADITQRPSMVINGNNIHLVWEEGVINAKIYYARGMVDENNNTVNWTILNDGGVRHPISSITGAFNAKQPDIVQTGTTLHVVFTDRLNESEQSVHYISCLGGCLAINNWQTAGSVSGQFVGVHASDPYDMISTLGVLNNCAMAYFHGVLIGENEQVLGTNSCNGWSESSQDIVSPLQNRAINPQIQTADDWWVYIVYQEIEIVQQGGEPVFLPPQIRFLRNEPAIYLPVIQKR